MLGLSLLNSKILLLKFRKSFEAEKSYIDVLGDYFKSIILKLKILSYNSNNKAAQNVLCMHRSILSTTPTPVRTRIFNFFSQTNSLMLLKRTVESYVVCDTLKINQRVFFIFYINTLMTGHFCFTNKNPRLRAELLNTALFNKIILFRNFYIQKGYSH